MTLPLVGLCLLVAGDLPDAATLRQQFRSPDAAVRLGVFDLFVLEALTGELKVPADLYPDLVPPLDDLDRRVRDAAATFWKGQGAAAMPALLAGMRHDRAETRRHAARAVPFVHRRCDAETGRKAIQQLERLLFDPDKITRAAAEEALRKLDALP